MLLYSIIHYFIVFCTTLATIVVVFLKFIISMGASVPPTLTTIFAIFAVVLIVQIPYIGTVAVVPYIYVIDILTILGIRRTSAAWSVVYDAQTKLPIDPAYITVRDMQGREVTTIITDLNGRFSLLLPQGLYVIEANKTNYTFPSALLATEKSDGKYSNLYFGSVIEVKDKERSIAVSIPMDPTEEDWNQVEKKRKKLFYRFDDVQTYVYAAKTYALLAIIFSVLRAAIYPVLHTLYAAGMSTLVGLAVYIIAWKTKQYAHSFVITKDSHEPVVFARVSIFSAATHAIVAKKTTSFEGQFTCLLSRGNYYLTIERRIDATTYKLVYTSPVFSVRDGYIGRRFMI